MLTTEQEGLEMTEKSCKHAVILYKLYFWLERE